MLLNGAHSDRSGERALHCIIPCVVMAVGYLTASYAKTPWVVVASLAATYTAFMSMQGPALAVPTQILAWRAAAAGIAAMNTITMFSGFVGPYWMGVMKDHSGSYDPGLRGLALPALLAAGTMYVLTQNLKRPAIGVGAEFAEEPVCRGGRIKSGAPLGISNAALLIEEERCRRGQTRGFGRKSLMR